MADSENWERKTLEKLAFSALQEQRRSRNWSIFFRLTTLAFLVLVTLSMMGWFHNEEGHSDKHTALVELRGVISAKGETHAEKVIDGLRVAFKDKGTQGVILLINSPGGSPVQAGYINDEIKQLRKKYPKIPMYAVVEDICASGGYYAAVATDKIYVDKASIVGSIGVLMDGFGFTGTMEKFGVERRLLTAGENKGFLDPFSPVSANQKEYALSMLSEIHQQFIAVVREGRGKRLKETPDMFSGLFWSGEKSIQLGLADALGSADYVAREVIKAENIVDFTPQDDISDRIAKRFGAAALNALNPLVKEGISLR